jgi:hypothetical protein
MENKRIPFISRASRSFFSPEEFDMCTYFKSFMSFRFARKQFS